MKQYIIQDFQGGVWSVSLKQFAGILYAGYYNSEDEAWKEAVIQAKRYKKTLTVTPVVR